MGESAGGNLAANVAIRAIAENITPPLIQLLLDPLAGNVKVVLVAPIRQRRSGIAVLVGRFSFIIVSQLEKSRTDAVSVSCLVQHECLRSMRCFRTDFSASARRDKEECDNLHSCYA
jgi:hypothetical protein